MWNTFLDTSNSGVTGDAIKPDNISDGYAGYVEAGAHTEFMWGIFLGFSLAVLLFVIYKISKRIIKKTCEEYDTTEDD